MMAQPLGYFVHHQGRGHAERCIALVSALPSARPVRIFCAKEDLFPRMAPHVTITRIPSLFEPTGSEVRTMDRFMTPSTLHCSPLGWPGIRKAMGEIVAWFAEANPALMICDVSAEIAQLCRICSVPHVKVLQHGNREDPGHRAAYDGAVGLLAPFAEELAQPEWSEAFRSRTFFAGGLGLRDLPMTREAARSAIGMDTQCELIVSMAGEGGRGLSAAPIAVGARCRPSARWITIGPVERDWHATEPSNLEHRGWVDNPGAYIAAADIVIASPGNATCQRILATGRPFIAVPEWRYFDEQHRKADALAAAGLAITRPHLPSSAGAWSRVIEEAYATFDLERQRRTVRDHPAEDAAAWIEGLIADLWTEAGVA
jgi:hypothetical protein